MRDTYRVIADHPGTGSPRYGDLLNVENLRSSKLRRFPVLVFYIEHEDHIDVWRILHAQRDIRRRSRIRFSRDPRPAHRVRSLPGNAAPEKVRPPFPCSIGKARALR